MKRLMVFLITIMMGAGLHAAGRIKIVTSIVPLMNITAAIAGEKADYQAMVPPGSSPHTFSPKPSQLRAMADAQLFIRVGSGMEFWADKMIKASGNKKLVVLTITDGVQLLAGDTDEPVDKNGMKAGNPHIWLDPVMTKEFSGRICAELSRMDPANASYYKANYAKFSAQLDALDKYFSEETAKFAVKEVISFHPAWIYFETRYGLKEAGVIEAVPGREPTPKDLESIIAAIKLYGIKTIFAEPQLPRKAADVIAKEAKVKVAIIDPNGMPDGDYIGFMKKNFEIIKKAMK